MIKNTFQLLPAVGPGKERTIWKDGVLDWSQFLDRSSVKGIADSKKKMADTIIEECHDFLREKRIVDLSARMPRKEHWRLYEEAREDVAYLDIETDGLSRDSLVTVVSVHRTHGTTTLVHGQGLNAESLETALDGATMLVTFNGSCFDVPVLHQSFPSLNFEIPHFDLRFGCRRIGLTGGLKKIETMTGLCRDEELASVDGEEAVRLWKTWKRTGDQKSLRTLIEYNRADTINLVALADLVYPVLVRRCLEC